LSVIWPEFIIGVLIVLVYVGGSVGDSMNDRRCSNTRVVVGSLDHTLAEGVGSIDKDESQIIVQEEAAQFGCNPLRSVPGDVQTAV
jgi:hypothetical protein